MDIFFKIKKIGSPKLRKIYLENTQNNFKLTTLELILHHLSNTNRLIKHQTCHSPEAYWDSWSKLGFLLANGDIYRTGWQSFITESSQESHLYEEDPRQARTRKGRFKVIVNSNCQIQQLKYRFWIYPVHLCILYPMVSCIA